MVGGNLASSVPFHAHHLWWRCSFAWPRGPDVSSDRKSDVYRNFFGEIECLSVNVDARKMGCLLYSRRASLRNTARHFKAKLFFGVKEVSCFSSVDQNMTGKPLRTSSFVIAHERETRPRTRTHRTQDVTTPTNTHKGLALCHRAILDSVTPP